MPVPYRSGGELATAVLTQATDTSIGDFAAMIPLIREGRLRALAVTSGARTPLAPDIPTMVEAGVPDYDVTTFFGIVAPAGTPDEIVRMLNTTLNDGLKTPEAQALIQRIGVVSHPGTPQEFAAFIASKRELWGAAAKAIGARRELVGILEMQHIPVLIVGGGPVGLALAGELGWRGVPCLLVEQGDGTIVTPKMNEVNVRTMEFCRRWGIADQVHNCPFPRDHARDAVFVTSFSGYELGRIPRPAVASPSLSPWSPMRLQTCSQMWFDPILRDFALSSPASTCVIARGLRSFQDTGDGVTAEIVDLESGKRERIEADYLVGCDGATSAIREQLGIGLTGQGVLGHPLHLFFRAPDLLKRVGKAEGTFFLAIDRGGLWANIRVVDPVNAMWRLMVLDSDGKQTPETIDKDALIRRAVGTAVRRRVGRLQHLDETKPRRREILQGPRVPCRRRRAPALADRRAWV